MEEMPTMREWRRLAAEGRLNGPAALFLEPTKPIEELYDIESDPDEIHNLASSEEHREVLERLREAHLKWLRDTRDLGFLPEADMWQRTASGTPYEMGRSAALYPQERILAAARRASVSEADATELLVDGDAAVRWWALVRLSPVARPLKEAGPPIEQAATDSSANVRLAAAELLCRADRCDAGLSVLATGLSSKDQYIRLDAANRLDRVGSRSRPLEELMRQALKDPNEDVRKVMRHALR